jgi:hypothetical protein
MRKVNDRSVDRMISIIFRERWVEVRWRTEVSRYRTVATGKFQMLLALVWLPEGKIIAYSRASLLSLKPARRLAIDALQSFAN